MQEKLYFTLLSAAHLVNDFKRCSIHSSFPENATSRNKGVGHMHSDIQELNNAID